ncbi:tRNA uridine-5-carboxymethylaminomethyl(34) synthesis GTPase MnmE [Allopseudospirillum japonicum]|uniref:tRNA uridine-5-carboxymethylaminomethyl(34) synthesis GTPase MnmE n=1 Tax=Allopseudospirillum japonicum TaxID=64971 RepID=UPI000B886A99
MMSSTHTQETIAALATAPGRGGVGMIRISGPLSQQIGLQLSQRSAMKPRYAHYGPWYDAQGRLLDEGICLWFPAPHSFTGEDVVELQGHGGPVLMDRLLQSVLALGARMARPGEFSERAFLNDKLDLAQAEAIADLIEASSQQAADNALRSLQGEFSQAIVALVEQVTQLRIYVEAAIDFPEEEIDFISDGKVSADLAGIIAQLAKVKASATQGALLRDGMTVVLAGRPNAGKSSLLNALAGRESAIVTEIAGTTRDVLREYIHIEGMPVHIVDTAGLRETQDVVERIGVERAWSEIAAADRVLLLVDASETQATDPYQIWPEFVERFPASHKVTVIRNKVDKTQEALGLDVTASTPIIRLAAKHQQGIDVLREHLKQVMGFQGTTEGHFSARRRHLDALTQAEQALYEGRYQLENLGAGELLAEDLRRAQQALGEITGAVSADDLLGKIFSSFCIGK